jgi:AAA family ATP:ADP antiporter
MLFASEAIDTFVYRGGDVVGAWAESLIARLGMGLLALSAVTIPLAVLWAGLGIWLGLQQRRITLAQDQADREVGNPEAGQVVPTAG